MTRTLLVCAVVSLAAAQAPTVGDINFYGLHKITPERILGRLNLKSGGPLPPSKGDLEDNLEELSGVVQARVEAVCCEGSQAVLFIGIEEKGAPHSSIRTEPSGDATLPQELVYAYQQFLVAVQRAASRGEASEDLSLGHPVMADSQSRAFQAQFTTFASEHLEDLRNVLKNAAAPEQRAIAAAVIDYAPRKKDIVNDLQYAMQDPDEPVRSNAVRSLTAIGVLAVKQPELGIKISPTWFIEMLNSIVLSDRVGAAKALLTLTDRADPAVLQQIREQDGLPALAEMARWTTPRYALAPFLLLGRLAGLKDEEVHQSWATGDRESVITKALETETLKRRK